MAKAELLYTGYDSRGRDVQVAKSVQGGWWCRSMEFTKYGCQWCKWTPYKTPSHPVRLTYAVECGNAPEFIDIPENERHNYIDWGFQVLRLHKDDIVRLPNV